METVKALESKGLNTGYSACRISKLQNEFRLLVIGLFYSDSSSPFMYTPISRIVKGLLGIHCEVKAYL